MQSLADRIDTASCWELELKEPGPDLINLDTLFLEARCQARGGVEMAKTNSDPKFGRRRGLVIPIPGKEGSVMPL
jgi:hypothetical protein